MAPRFPSDRGPKISFFPQLLLKLEMKSEFKNRKSPDSSASFSPIALC